MKQKQTHRHREQTAVAKGEGSGGGMDWEFGISRCKLLYTGWINNKVLLYSTGNYIQYPVINHNGTEKNKLKVCMWKGEECLGAQGLSLRVGWEGCRVPGPGASWTPPL